MKKRNSLIELFRFIFAINVVKSHGYLPYNGKYLGPGRISVEFFFILTGFLLVKSVNKYLDKPFWKGLGLFYLSKIKGILIPVLIAIPFNILYSVINNEAINIWGFLWYVKQMLIYIPIFFTLRYFIRKDKFFVMTMGIIFVVATIMNLTPQLYEWGFSRSMMGITLGVLLSFVPPIKIRKQNLMWLAVIPFTIAAMAILIFETDMVLERIAHFIVYPGLIYFTFQVQYENKFFNYLGALSFGLYAFQCVVRPLPTLGCNNVWVLFGIIVGLTLLEDGIKRIIRLIIKINRNKKEKRLKQIEA